MTKPSKPTGKVRCSACGVYGDRDQMSLHGHAKQVFMHKNWRGCQKALEGVETAATRAAQLFDYNMRTYGMSDQPGRNR